MSDFGVAAIQQKFELSVGRKKEGGLVKPNTQERTEPPA
jgi:hypothetical protein